MSIVILRQATQIKVRVGPAVFPSGDMLVPVTTLSLSGADEAELLKANGAATVDISGATFAAVTGCDGYYDLTLTTSHTDTVGEMEVVINDDSLILPIKHTFQVIEEAVYDRDYAASALGYIANAPVNAAQVGGQTASAAATVTFPATIASTTNITAGTITTTTNLTNLPTIPANWLTAAGTAADFGTEVGTAVWASATRTLTAGTNVDGSTFTAIPWNAAWDAEVQSEVDDALVAQRLDELLNADSDIDGAAPPTVGSVFHELMTKTAGSFTFDQTTDSLEALRDRGDAAWTTATGFSTHSAADVWTSGTRTLTAGTNIQLPSNGLANVTAWTVNITGNLSGSVGSVTTVSDKTGYSLASTGLNLVIPADPGTTEPTFAGSSTIVQWIAYFGAWSVNAVTSDSDSVNLRNTANNADLAAHAISDNGTTFSSGAAG
jgi:hypothetical protein